MQILYSLDDLSAIEQPIHLALGVFDGVHAGHKEVIMSAVRHARGAGELSGILTFDEHPLQLIAPERAPKRLLANVHHKQQLLAELGIDVLITLRFNQELASLNAGDFLHKLATGLTLRSVSVGEDWRFGRERQGGIDFLRQEGQRMGFQVYIISPVLDGNGLRISSTAIREAIAVGRLEDARRMLGREYTVIGKVVPGRKLARELGYPTANIDVYNEQLPPRGVYLVKAVCDSCGTLYGVANLGGRPTVEDTPDGTYLEVHLFDWSGDLYGQELEITFLHYLRAEKTFPGLEALRKQISVDESQAKALLKKI